MSVRNVIYNNSPDLLIEKSVLKFLNNSAVKPFYKGKDQKDGEACYFVPEVLRNNHGNTKATFI